MNVIRLVVLRSFVIYRMEAPPRSRVGQENREQGGKRGKDNGTGGGSKVQDVLVEDPVCHTLVPKHQAIRLRENKTDLLFLQR